MGELKVFINGREVKAKEGSTILETALEAGIYIPYLCHHPNLPPIGECGLCLVRVNGMGLVNACDTLVEEGMKIVTENEEIASLRRERLTGLLMSHLFRMHRLLEISQM
uniref:2Fe-2S iron-sulfur cluster binding domain-containing protein n=1 Tax=candidate division WOR-3 bacterium TaxID=2052148 RepID=A0A7C2NYH1_UNCW3